MTNKGTKFTRKSAIGRIVVPKSIPKNSTPLSLDIYEKYAPRGKRQLLLQKELFGIRRAQTPMSSEAIFEEMDKLNRKTSNTKSGKALLEKKSRLIRELADAARQFEVTKLTSEYIKK
jgi:hypothetical protein